VDPAGGSVRHRQGGARELPAWRSRRVHRAFLKAQKALSPDGTIPDQGAATALRALQSVDPALQNAKLDLKAVYTNDFVRKANAKYPKV
jgi:hypothetical protein